MAEKFDLSVILKFIDKSGTGLKSFSKKMKGVGDGLTSFGKEMTAKVTLPILAMGGFALKSAIDIESAFTGVQKTVNGTAEELGKLKEDIKGLSLEIPIDPVELFAVAEAAGQLGIETKNIVGFTKVMADLGVATNLTSDEAASALAKFANITGLSQDQFDRLGSTIVDLGNKTATTEKDIVAMALRLAGAGNTVGLTEAQILAFAASLSSVGIEAEAGGTAFSQVFKRIDKEIGSGSKKMDDFAFVSGKTTEEFEKAWKENAADAVLSFVEGIDKAGKAGYNVNQVLDQLGLEGIRISDALLRAAGANEKFNQAQIIGTKAWKENIALQNEAALRYKTTGSQLILFKNEVKLLGNEFGKIMIPALRETIKGLRPLIDGLKKLSPEMKTNILKIAGIFAIGGPLVIGLGAAAAAIGFLLTPIGLVVGAIALIGAAVAGMIIYWEEFSALLDNPFFTTPLLIFAPFIAIPALIIKHWVPIKKFFSDMWSSIVAEQKATWELAKQRWNETVEGIKKAFNAIPAFMTDLWKNKIPQPIKDGIEFIKNLFLDFTPLGLIIKHWDPIVTYFKEIFETIESYIPDFLKNGLDLPTIDKGKAAEETGAARQRGFEAAGFGVPKAVTEAQQEQRPKTLSELVAAGRDVSQTEIVVKVESENGTTAKVQKVTSKGSTDVRVTNQAAVGPTIPNFATGL